MPEFGTSSLLALLQQLRGGGFNADIVLNGVIFNGQKVVAFENNVVFTVDDNGRVHATPVANILSASF